VKQRFYLNAMPAGWPVYPCRPALLG